MHLTLLLVVRYCYIILLQADRFVHALDSIEPYNDAQCDSENCLGVG